MASQREIFGALLTILLIQIILSIYGTAFLVTMPYWDKIYPGGSVKGISLDGMSREEAEISIANQIQVQMPSEVLIRNGDQFLRMNLQRAGITFSPGDTAAKAYQRGREGGLLYNALGYLRISDQNEDIPICLNLDEALFAHYLTTLTEGQAGGGQEDLNNVEKVREALQVFFVKYYGYPVEIH